MQSTKYFNFNRHVTVSFITMMLGPIQYHAEPTEHDVGSQMLTKEPSSSCCSWDRLRNMLDDRNI